MPRKLRRELSGYEVRNDINVLRPLMPEVRTLLPTVEPGRLYHIGSV